MANVDLYEVPDTAEYAEVEQALGHDTDTARLPVLASVGAAGQVIWRYKMQAQDAGAAPPGFVYWIASGTADEAGAGYAGASPAPIGAMVVGSVRVLARWQG